MLEEIIHFLKQREGFISGEEISRSLKISRAAIWKYVHQLRDLGYDIAAVPHRGYRLESVPDKLFPWEIRDDLRTKIFGKEVIYHETVKSTMDEAFQLGVRGVPEGTVVCAEGQTRGRGRLGRAWISPRGKGVYFSVLLRPRLPLSRVAELTLLSAVAVCEAVNRTAGIRSRIKWPNDILIDGRKTGGILTELSAEMDRVNFVVVGIGINVAAIPGKLPPGAACLKDVAPRKITRTGLVRDVLRSLEHWYAVIHGDGMAPVIKRWKELSLTLGRRVRVVEPGGVIQGLALDLDQDGGLLLRTAAGQIVKKMSGDVVLA